MARWQKNLRKQKLQIKEKVFNKAEEFKEIHFIPEDVVDAFLNEFNDVLDAVTDQDKLTVRAEMQDAKQKCNKLIDDFIEKNWMPANFDVTFIEK